MISSDKTKSKQTQGQKIVKGSKLENKLMEEALRESEERYRALFERSIDSVYLHDFQGRFIDANPAALKLVGYSLEEITSLTMRNGMAAAIRAG
jgi:PAS domain-containing protein